MKKYCTLITLLLVSSLANAAPLRFDFTFAENPGTGRTTGFIVFESTLLSNPGGGFYTLPNPVVLDLQITVTGTANDNGLFTLADFTDVSFQTGGIALDFSRNLVGQTTNSSPWGTPGQGGKTSEIKGRPAPMPDFSLFSNQQQPAKNSNDSSIKALLGSLPPSSVAPFILGTPSGVFMPLVSFAPLAINPIPSLNSYSIFIFAVLLLLVGFFTFRKRV